MKKSEIEHYRNKLDKKIEGAFKEHKKEKTRRL